MQSKTIPKNRVPALCDSSPARLIGRLSKCIRLGRWCSQTTSIILKPSPHLIQPFYISCHHYFIPLPVLWGLVKYNSFVRDFLLFQGEFLFVASYIFRHVSLSLQMLFACFRQAALSSFERACFYYFITFFWFFCIFFLVN